MGEKAQSRNYLGYVHACIILAFMISGHFVPVIEPITRMGMQIIGVFLGMIWGWIFCDLLWPSVLGIVMLGLTEYAASPEKSLGLMLQNSTILAMLSAFIFFAFISKSGLLDIAMNWLLTRKFMVGKPWKFIVIFLIAIGILALAFNMIILMLLAFEFMGKLFKRMGYTKDDVLPSYIFLGIGMFAGFGPLLIPYMPTALITKGLVAQCLGGVPLDLAQWIWVMDVPVFIAWALYLIIGKFVVRPDVTKFAAGTQVILDEMSKQGKKNFTSEQKYALVALIVFIVCNAAIGIAPNAPVIAYINKLGLVGITLILTVILAVLQYKDGTPILEIGAMAKAGVQWNMLFLVGAIMTITSALTSQGTGIAAAMATYVVPLVSNVSVVTFVIVVTVAICALSQVSMNMVLTMTFAPILTPVAVALGFNPLVAIMAILLGSKMAFLSPSGCQMAALVFGQKEWVTAKNIYKCCIPWLVVTLISWILCSLLIPNFVMPM